MAPELSFADSYAADPDGGVLLDLCHEIDLAFLLCGSAPASVSSIEHPDFAGVDIATTLICVNRWPQHTHCYGLSSTSADTTGTHYRIGTRNRIRRRKCPLHQITADKRVTQNLGQERNTMFVDFMSDFMALAEGRETTNPHIPRLDRVEDVCLRLKEREMREFKGQLRANLT